MGLEVAAVITAVAAVAGTYSSIKANQAQKAANADAKEASNVAAAQQKQQEMDARRNAFRQQRIRQAQIEQGAANTGTQSSSGELGSLAALSTNAGTKLSALSGASLANQGIAAANQAGMDAQGSAQNWQAMGSIFSTVGRAAGSSGGDAQLMKWGTSAYNGLFGNSSSTAGAKLNNDVDNAMYSNPDLF